MRFVLGVDLGQQQDPTAIVLLEHFRRLEDPNLADTPEWERRPKKIRNAYITRLIERPELGTPYLEVVDRLEAIMQNPKIVGEVQLVADATGVGLPVVELMRERGLNPIGVWITSGGDVHRTDYGYKVPKKDLATALQLVYQSRRIQVPRNIELARILMNELTNFRVKITSQDNTKYEAWRSSQHDDLVLAQAIAVWYAERVYPQSTRLDNEQTTAPDWNPLEF